LEPESAIAPSRYSPPLNALPQGNVAAADFKGGGYTKYDVRSISSDTFWKIIQERGHRFTLKQYPHECPIHRDGPIQMVAMDLVIFKLRDLHTIDRKTELQMREQMALLATLKKLQFDVQEYQLHLVQYERCRPLSEDERCTVNLNILIKLKLRS
jgi:hypothetical protein